MYFATFDRPEEQKRRLLQWAMLLLCVFNVLIPKGGIQVGGVPLTWGYALLGVFAVAALPRFILTIGKQLWQVWFILFAAAPVQAAVIYSAVSYPITETGFAVAIITIFLVLPFIILVLFGPYWDLCDQAKFLKVFRECVFYAAIYGLFLFLWYMKTGHYIEIPYITINAGDVGTLGTVKENLRGGNISKLISTYTNGNIYGICTLILLPLFDHAEGTRRWRKGVVRLALVLTLSRSVWFALIFAQLLSPIMDALSDFPRPRVSMKTVYQLLMVVPIIGLIAIGLVLIHADTSFLLPSDLGGRSDQFQAFQGYTLLPGRPLEGISEVVYASMLTEFGVLGLLGIILLFFSPLLLAFNDHGIWRNPIRRAALFGLLLYAFIAAMDGAINYIPTMTFWWFLVMLVTREPQEEPQPTTSAVDDEPTTNVSTRLALAIRR